MKNHVKLLFTLTLAILLAGCSSQPREVVVDGKYKMDIPGDMTSTITLNDEASLQYLNVFKELYVMVIEDVPEEVYSAIDELELEDGYSRDFNGFCMLATFTEENVFANINDRDKFTDTTINGLKARTFTNTRTIEGMEVYYKVALIEGKDTYYQIITWTLPQRSKKYETIMDDMLYSFAEINP